MDRKIDWFTTCSKDKSWTCSEATIYEYNTWIPAVLDPEPCIKVKKITSDLCITLSDNQ